MKTTTNIRITKRGEFIATYRLTAERPFDEYFDNEAEAVDTSVELLTEGLIVGDEYIVGTQSNTMTGKEYLIAKPHDGEGFHGNMSSTVKRYHGWRGTTDNVAIYAYGVRRLLGVKITGKRSKVVTVRFGRDLVSDKD